MDEEIRQLTPQEIKDRLEDLSIHYQIKTSDFLRLRAEGKLDDSDITESDAIRWYALHSMEQKCEELLSHAPPGPKYKAESNLEESQSQRLALFFVKN
jgi:hypothetical protein